MYLHDFISFGSSKRLAHWLKRSWSSGTHVAYEHCKALGAQNNIKVSSDIGHKTMSVCIEGI